MMSKMIPFTASSHTTIPPSAVGREPALDRVGRHG
jgi:hypothetical protein